jgi:hypothetical protein
MATPRTPEMVQYMMKLDERAIKHETTPPNKRVRVKEGFLPMASEIQPHAKAPIIIPKSSEEIPKLDAKSLTLNSRETCGRIVIKTWRKS